MTTIRAVEADADWPVGTDSFFQPRRAAFWVMTGLIFNGLVYTLHMFSTGLRVVPVTVLLGLLAWAGYTAAFLLAFRFLDLLDEHPWEGFVLAFGWGGLGAVFFAAPANLAIQSLCSKLVSPEFTAAWGAALAGPTTEEFLKLAGVVLLILVARNQFHTYLSVLIVGAMTGLGFQVVENLAYTVRAAMHFPLESQLEPVLLNLLTRGLLAGLWTHAAFSTVASFGVAWFLLHPRRPLATRLAMVLVCFTLAWFLHFIWNSPLLEGLFGSGATGMVLLSGVKGMPVMLGASIFWHAAARENGAYLHALGAYFVPERDLIADDEWLRLGAPLLRWRARRDIHRRFGAQAGRLKARLQRDQLRLIHKAATYGRGSQTRRHEIAILQLREALELSMARGSRRDAALP